MRGGELVEGFDEAELIFLRVDAAVAGEYDRLGGDAVRRAKGRAVARGETRGIDAVAEMENAVVRQ